MPKFDWSKLGPFVTAVKTACGAGSMEMGKVVQNDVKQNFGGGRYVSGPVGKPPNDQRGRLRLSIQVQPSGRLSAIVGSNLPYGPMHEFGGTIHAKTTKYLPVPLNKAAKALMEDKGKQSLRVMGPFSLQFSRRNIFLVGSKKISAKANVYDSAGLRKYKTIERSVPRFVLKKSIRIPKRPFMAPALARARNNPSMVNTFAVGTTKALAKSGFPVKVVPA